MSSFNSRIGLATYYQFAGGVFPVMRDSDSEFAVEVEPEHDGEQPVLTSAECEDMVTAGMIRRAKLVGGAFVFENGQELVLLAPIP